ncbi:RmlC-like cupin domain-containing protein [Nemania sp. FL0916]|nr:RmlC-like cupin domain-containing protein [Nemania sp. FL0916]
MSRRTLLLASCIALAIVVNPLTAQAATTTTTTTTNAPQCSGIANDQQSQHHYHHATAQDIVSKLNLIPNVEGGYYVESFRDPALEPGTNRSVSTAIYYLLEGSNGPSVWHRVDASEVWHYYAGARLVLQLSSNNGTPTREHVLGPNLFAGDGDGDGERPQVVVAEWEWQRAISCGEWTLVGTTVAPAFDPEGYELAPDGWEPNDGT